MYVEVIVNGKPIQAMIDTGADYVYMAKKSIAEEVGLSYLREKGWVKGVNANSLAKGIRRWSGHPHPTK